MEGVKNENSLSFVQFESKSDESRSKYIFEGLVLVITNPTI